jgi:carbamoyl-phosphate synthase small subunit
LTDQAVLALEDGSVFMGRSIGAEGETVGEVVFNTAMSGYQEILTDPSYARQVVTLTYPHIGNTGCNPEDEESARPMAAGLIVRDCPRRHSNWRATESLPEYLQRNGIVAISDIDTRRLTRILREQGAQGGAILAGPAASSEAAIDLARSFPGMKGMDLARKVIPATTPAEDALALQPDGIFLSNGPGDPEPCDYAISAIQEFIARKIPLFGICLGHQLLGLAAGGRTMKMKFGHHGANHPVQELESGRVMITSQNHGFAVDEDSLPENARATHRSLFDQSLQGLELTQAPAFGFQGHPEASPGPHDIAGIFDRFIDSIDSARQSDNVTVLREA